MTLKRALLFLIPMALMLIALWGLTGIETGLASFATTQKAYLLLGRIGLTLPFLVSAGLGLIVLFSVRGSLDIKWAGFGVLGGGLMVFAIAALREALRLTAFTEQVQPGTLLHYADLYSLGGAGGALFVGLFGLKVGLKGNSAFGDNRPKRVSGRRSIHGESDWMDGKTAAKLFPEDGGIVIGERYRVDQDSVSEINFDPRHNNTWGKGGKAPLVAFDQGFGSTHGIVFAGSGGYKTTSVVIPTCLQYPGSMIVLDPSTEIAPMVLSSRNAMGQKVICLDPRNQQVGFNVLDWIGQFGSSMEEDMATVAAWLMSEKPRIASGADDFFRTNAEQLITSVIAHVVFSDLDNSSGKRSLRTVRSILTKPEENLKEFLADIHDTAPNEFVKELVGPFINMTPQTFSGVYATAAKETHWLSYETYAALVSGNTFKTDIIANGRTTIFLNIDLSTLENHPGMARVIIGAFLKAVYNRDGDINGRVLFLLDEVARLGYMRIIETARDAGRKYGISLVMLFQSLGQMREAFGGRDATSKWFESASWVSFAAINDPDTARYISERCGMTTIEVEQVSRSSRSGQVSRNRSRQLSQRPLIQPHEVLQMRSDEQIVFTSGNEPLRCGRAMFFRRKEMTEKVSASRFRTKAI
ncbi:Ti-type conjugative transfer system protein TraG [Roseibium aggregatum]|uniref:Ti-type conjugative transfer system protein TraG n=1 Tax=Roseibium aggregatum TaxID=187304 RepID=UPI001E3D770E|nr:Ti-type conjugative transfer system protein TraG [Roseibium aggregatum]UES42117.1 Ti-type conjugative transfer system protein TraG [Roseibium aggregatum]